MVTFEVINNFILPSLYYYLHITMAEEECALKDTMWMSAPPSNIRNTNCLQSVLDGLAKCHICNQVVCYNHRVSSCSDSFMACDVCIAYNTDVAERLNVVEDLAKELQKIHGSITKVCKPE